MSKSTAITLSIAGSDSGGGAGIQADIKAISATGGYACTVLTALTAQNTQGVQGIHSISSEFIRQQIDSVFADLAVKAVKIGMLADADTIDCVAEALLHYQPEVVILDPVMVASSGDLLLQPQALSSLQNRLIAQADLITPNLYEAQVLLGTSGEALPQSLAELKEMALQLQQQGTSAVLLKGGHGSGATSTDVLCQNGVCEVFEAQRVASKNTHGTGCSLSSAIASYCAQGHDMNTAVGLAKSYISAAIAHADQLHVGSGAGPVHHFYALGGSDA